MLQVIVLLESKSSSRSRHSSGFQHAFLQGLSGLSSIHFPPLSLWVFQFPEGSLKYPPCFTAGMLHTAWGLKILVLSGHRKYLQNEAVTSLWANFSLEVIWVLSTKVYFCNISVSEIDELNLPLLMHSFLYWIYIYIHNIWKNANL